MVEFPLCGMPPHPWSLSVQLVCLDLEGVLVPEIWIEFSQRTGIPELRRTTRDEPDYDKLMKYRLGILAQHKLGLPDIQAVIAAMGPMEGAKDFLDDLRQRFQVIILSDTFYEFAMPLMRQLGMPTLFCHKLEADASGTLVNALLAHCGASLSGIGGVMRPGIVHRIDKETSGLLLLVKTQEAFIFYKHLFLRR